MNDFEDRLRNGLARRAHAATPIADLDGLDERIEANARYRRRVAVIAATSTAVVVFATAAVATTVDRGKVAVSASATTTTEESATTIAPPTTVFLVTPSTVGATPSTTATPATTTSTIPQSNLSPDELEIQQLFATLFDPMATDAQRLALIDDPTGLEPVMQAIRAHPRYGQLGTVHVQVTNVTYYGPLSNQADLVLTVPGFPPLYGHPYVRKIDGVWKVEVGSFCGGLRDFTTSIGGPVLDCAEILHSTPPPTTVKATPTTTTSSSTTTTVP